MHIHFALPELAQLDELRCEALALPFFSDERPLRGALGLVDWRLCGMVSSLIIEGMAQTGGLLVGEMSQFENRVVLAKIGKAVFHHNAFPGDVLTYRAKIENMQPLGAIVKGECHIADSLQAEIELVFAHLDDRFEGVELFEPANFLRMLRLLKLYEVGRDSAGNKLEIPARMLAAEKAYLNIEQS